MSDEEEERVGALIDTLIERGCKRVSEENVDKAVQKKESCQICQFEYSGPCFSLSACAHIFHSNCLNNLFENCATNKHVICPCCNSQHATMGTKGQAKLLAEYHLIQKVVICQAMARKLIATKEVATLRYLRDNDFAQGVVYYVVDCQRFARGWIARKPAFPLSHPPTHKHGMELLSALRGANMTKRYDQALAQAGESRGELKKVLQQASDLGQQTISFLWQYYIFTEKIEGGVTEAQQKDLIMSLIRSLCYLTTGRRFSCKDLSDSQPINETISKGFPDGYTGRSIKDFEKGNLKQRFAEAVLKLYDGLQVERQVIRPVRRCLEAMHKAIMIDVTDHDVRKSLAVCAGNTMRSSRCYQTVPIHFGAERWELARDLILKKIPREQFLSDLGSFQRVKLVESCFKQSIIATNEFRETKTSMKQVQGTYRCVTKQKTWDLLKNT